jgi:putative flippase GtrA
MGFLLFEGVSLLGLVINLGVFQFLQSTGWGFDLLGREASRYLHHIAGLLVALVTNYFLNVNYTWRRRVPTA